MALTENVLDKLVRDSQDSQTIGIPIGPDTSLVIAELVMTAVDHALGSQVSPIGYRFVDDIELEAHTERFLQDLAAAGRARSTRNHYLRLVKLLGRWAVRKKYTCDPFFGPDCELRQDREQPRNRRLMDDEEERLMKAASPSLQRLIIAALALAARLGELLSLQWRDVDLNRRKVTLRANKTKNGCERVLPVSHALAAVLELVKNDPDGKPYGPAAFVFGNAVGSALARSRRHGGRRAGKPISPDYDSMTCAMKQRPASPRQGGPHHVSDMLGHTTLKQTSDYVNVKPDGVAETMRKYDQPPPACKAVANLPSADPTASWQQLRCCDPQQPHPLRVRLARPAGLEPATFGLEGQRRFLARLSPQHLTGFVSRIVSHSRDLRFLQRQELRKLRARLAQIRLSHDRVAVEDRARLMAAPCHCEAFGRASPNQVPDDGPPQIVQQRIGTAGCLRRLRPFLPPVSNGHVGIVLADMAREHEGRAVTIRAAPLDDLGDRPNDGAARTALSSYCALVTAGSRLRLRLPLTISAPVSRRGASR